MYGEVLWQDPAELLGPNMLIFQWQDRKQVPVVPKEIMEEAGVTYTFPDWAGPWDELT